MTLPRASDDCFSLVYLVRGVSPRGEVRIAIRTSATAARLEPAHSALGVGGRLLLSNDTPDAHVVSLPDSSLLRSIAPGETVELALDEPGPHGVFLLDAGAEAVVFAAPGPFAVVSSSGQWQLRDLRPGRVRLRTWHPRFPDAEHEVEIAADRAVRLDLELGVEELAATHRSTGGAR